ncbi:alpha/beta hydrolase [Candidatus Pacearchaeota archaeon]|nr:alpha/beta hydrolase [Candidatus Pacearchaeota archaeon]
MKVVIIHGSPKSEEMAKESPQNKAHWIYWIKNKLENQGIKTYTPLMPICWKPTYQEWKEEFEKIPIDEETILIGHSAGGAFLTKWLGETNEKIKKLILVAPAIINLKKEVWELDKFYDFEINKNLQNNVKEIILIESDNDSESILESCKIYSEMLNIKPIVLKNKGHFTERGMGTKEFPELLEEVLKE